MLYHGYDKNRFSISVLPLAEQMILHVGHFSSAVIVLLFVTTVIINIRYFSITLGTILLLALPVKCARKVSHPLSYFLPWFFNEKIDIFLIVNFKSKFKFLEYFWRIYLDMNKIYINPDNFLEFRILNKFFWRKKSELKNGKY